MIQREPIGVCGLITPWNFPVILAILGYDNVEDAIRIANDTSYGLSAYVQGGDMERVREVGGRIRAGQVTLNASALDILRHPSAAISGPGMVANGVKSVLKRFSR